MGSTDDLRSHRQGHGYRSDAHMAVAPQDDRENAGTRDQQSVQQDQVEREQRVEPQRFVKTAGVMIDCLPNVGILVLCACEQFHRNDVGVRVDDTAGQHRARFRHHLLLVLHARHEIPQHCHIAREPQQHGQRQPTVC
jgi:hypothetical protein